MSRRPSPFATSMKEDRRTAGNHVAKVGVLGVVEPIRRVELDVRHYHDEGRDPFEDIMAVVDSLREDQEFVLINTFEPLPLYRVLGRKGFEPRAEQLGPRHWRITFRRGGPAPRPARPPRPAAAGGPTGPDGPDPSLPPVELDNRGLQPPEPMTRVLQALSEAAPGQAVVARNDRKPVFLLPILEERGYRFTGEDLADGGYRLTVWRPPGAAGRG